MLTLAGRSSNRPILWLSRFQSSCDSAGQSPGPQFLRRCLYFFGQLLGVVEVGLLQGILSGLQHEHRAIVNRAPGLRKATIVDRIQRITSSINGDLRLFCRLGRIWCPARCGAAALAEPGREGEPPRRPSLSPVSGRFAPPGARAGATGESLWAQQPEVPGLGLAPAQASAPVRSLSSAERAPRAPVARAAPSLSRTRMRRSPRPASMAEQHAVYSLSSTHACGNVSRKRVPRPGVDCTSTSPSCSCTIR